MTFRSTLIKGFWLIQWLESNSSIDLKNIQLTLQISDPIPYTHVCRLTVWAPFPSSSLIFSKIPSSNHNCSPLAFLLNQSITTLHLHTLHTLHILHISTFLSSFLISLQQIDFLFCRLISFVNLRVRSDSSNPSNIMFFVHPSRNILNLLIWIIIK